MDETRDRSPRFPVWGWITAALWLVSVFLPFPQVTDAMLADPGPELVDVLKDSQTTLLIRNGLSWLTAASLVIFSADLFRRLRDAESERSTVPIVALSGGLVTAAGLLIGFGFLAQLAGAASEGRSPASIAAIYGAADGLGYGAWTALGLTTGAVAVAGFKLRSVARWFAVLSALFTAVFFLLAFFPFVAWFPATLWLLIAPLGLRHQPLASEGASSAG